MNNSTLFLIVIFAFFNIVLQPIIWDSPEQDMTIEVDCYDANYNKIDELTCTEEIPGVPLTVKIIFSFIILLLLIAAVIIFILHEGYENPIGILQEEYV